MAAWPLGSPSSAVAMLRRVDATPVFWATWERNPKTNQPISETRDCPSIAGFLFVKPKPKNERRKHEQKPKTGLRRAEVASATQAGADRVRPRNALRAAARAAGSLPRVSG